MPRPEKGTLSEFTRMKNDEKIHSCELGRKDGFSHHFQSRNISGLVFFLIFRAFLLSLFKNVFLTLSSLRSSAPSAVKNGFGIYGILLFLAVNSSFAFSQTASLPYTTGFESAD
ncbi:MAG: hypothetical protein V4507_02425, partial [Verrucomicrobiota bacterium]